MPRKRRTQAAQTAGLEAGAAYGEVGENLAAQNPDQGGIPLPQAESVAPAGPAPLPVQQAQGFNPQTTPLLAPGQNIPATRAVAPPTVNDRTSMLLQNWAEATGDPVIAEAAAQLRGR